ncbi:MULTISPECIES: hypothetical protein [unclassified Sphingopyxis]|jgi:hypothetical protein|uniref:hypothetical protein n=1 Tax=unclassified Sphingopyxis TaxID=2614943 RepID=UPI0025E84767|nr:MULTISPECIES: hypothetical protein [unclassified Sphingopyxis]
MIAIIDWAAREQSRAALFSGLAPRRSRSRQGAQRKIHRAVPRRASGEERRDESRARP